MLHWLNATVLNLPDIQAFNLVVANSYDRELDQRVPFHSDAADLLGSPTDVVSLSVGKKGADALFCWEPKKGSKAFPRLRKKIKDDERMNRMIEKGLRGGPSAFLRPQLIMSFYVYFYMPVLPMIQFPNEAPFVVLWRCGAWSAM